MCFNQGCQREVKKLKLCIIDVRPLLYLNLLKRDLDSMAPQWSTAALPVHGVANKHGHLENEEEDQVHRGDTITRCRWRTYWRRHMLKENFSIIIITLLMLLLALPQMAAQTVPRARLGHFQSEEITKCKSTLLSHEPRIIQLFQVLQCLNF